MKLADAILSAYWSAAGYAAARTGDYGRALSRFDRAELRRKHTPLIAGYRTMVLMLMGQKDEARSAFRDLANSEKPDNRNDEYARLYAKIYISYLEDNLVEADRLSAELHRINCRPGIKNLLIPIDRPSLLAADSLLSSLGIGEADPLGFRDEGSGVHWMNAVKAYSKLELVEALDEIEQAAAIRAASSAQRAVKAAILIHLRRPDDASLILKEVEDGLTCPADVDERYLRLFCKIYRPSIDPADQDRLMKEAKMLEPVSALRHFLAIGGGSEAESFKAHFQSLKTAYGNRSFNLNWDQA